MIDWPRSQAIAAFADRFFGKYIEGHDVPDYEQLLARAGIVFRKREPGRAWLGDVSLDANGRVSNLLGSNSPAIEAGFDQDDVINSVDGKPLGAGVTIQSIISAHKPGDRVAIGFTHPDGKTGTGTVTLGEDPEMVAVTIESTGGTRVGRPEGVSRRVARVEAPVITCPSFRSSSSRLSCGPSARVGAAGRKCGRTRDGRRREA